MSRLGSWLRGSAKAPKHTQPSNVDEEAGHLAEALGAATYIMDDDIEGAEAELEKGNSSFHQLGRGVTIFMRALLGFEPEIMKTASERLAEAEASAGADQKKAQKDGRGFRSSIYPPGTEYGLVVAEAELMSAVVAVLNENLTDGIRGFYKLRKAFMTLDGIMEVEHRYMRQREGISGSSHTSISSQMVERHMPGGFDNDDFVDVDSIATENGKPTIVVDEVTNQGTTENGISSPENNDSDLEFVDADEAHSGAQTPANYLGHVTTNETMEKQLNHLDLDKHQAYQTPDSNNTSTDLQIPKRDNINLEPDADIFSHPIDVFVHSGANLCYGLLLLIISLVPPAFSKLLTIIGFKGDRERGIGMLWQSTKFSNINGAVAGLVLLGYYNINVGFSDILLPETDAANEDLRGYPRAKCQTLLTDMRTRYPKSRIWRLEEARMTSGRRDLKGAIEMLRGNEGSPMKQIAALNKFELSLTTMFSHDYILCAETFLSVAEISNWSHVLYYYIAGAALVDLYRDLKDSDPVTAKVHKDKAVELLRIAPTFAGKKRFMAKQLPFDLFVVRKVQKWESRVQEWGVDFIDVIGVSPFEEMVYLWNGAKRMGVPELERSLKNLEWARATNPQKHEPDLDEMGIQALLSSALLRNLGRLQDARDILKDRILSHDW
jgi:hypothetical protein